MLTDEEIKQIGDDLDAREGTSHDTLLWNLAFARDVIKAHERAKWLMSCKTNGGSTNEKGE
jgi:hypothetical protein